MLRSILSALLIALPAVLPAQEGVVPAFQYIRARPAAFGVAAEDVIHLRQTDAYASPDGTGHVYVQQEYAGVPVYNALASVHFRGGRVVHHTSRLEAALGKRIEAAPPALFAGEALYRHFPAAAVTLEDARLQYYPLPGNDRIRLAWQLTVALEDEGLHLLSVVDAITGGELLRDTLTVSCGAERMAGNAGAGALPESRVSDLEVVGDGAVYHVFPFGTESPRAGGRTLAGDPSDAEASPYGWHDTDGRPGAEYTITRGNNAYAYRDADTIPDVPDPSPEADGGPELDFDFFFAEGGTPDSLAPASLTQLFYTTNMVHDWAYAHGFDEAAGNFQQNNYGRGGRGGDFVRAESQNGSSPGNATFYTPGDGSPPRMQLSLWPGTEFLVEVTGPEELAERLPTGRAEFGGKLSAMPLVAALALGRDASDRPGLGCGPLTNAAQLAGKVVLLERGECTFQQKAYNAERAGARAVIIVPRTTNWWRWRAVGTAPSPSPSPYSCCGSATVPRCAIPCWVAAG